MTGILDPGYPIDGTLGARISLAGTLLKPAIRAQAEISSVRVGDVGLEKITADVRLDEESLTLTARGRQPGEFEDVTGPQGTVTYGDEAEFEDEVGIWNIPTPILVSLSVTN